MAGKFSHDQGQPWLVRNCTDGWCLMGHIQTGADLRTDPRALVSASRSEAIAGLLEKDVTKNLRVSAWMLIACGVWLVGLGLYFIVLRPPLLPEDPRFMGTTLAQIRTAVPGLESWLQKVFTVMGGFMASAGVLTVFVATVAMPQRLTGTSSTIALSGALTVALMSATNFALDSDFRWLLLVPALVWLAGLVLYLRGR